MKILVALPLNERQKEKLEQNFRHQEFVYCLPEELTKETISDVEVILGNVPQELLVYAGKLKWLQLNNAGTEGYCDGALPEEVLLTNELCIRDSPDSGDECGRRPGQCD